MTTSTQDFVTVDMRSLKALLLARAQAERVSVSVLVRAAVASALGVPEPREPVDATAPLGDASAASTVKLSIRLTAVEAGRLASGARAAGLSRGAFLSGLVAGVPVLSQGGSRSDHLAVVTASTAELATLSRGLNHLARLLREGNFRPAEEYLPMLERLGVDVRRHLETAANVLAELRPRRASSEGGSVLGGSDR